MKESPRRKIRLVDIAEHVGRKEARVLPAGDLRPRRHEQEREAEIADRQPRQRTRLPDRPLAAEVRGERADRDQELPGERIEHPALGMDQARKVHRQEVGGGPQADREHQCLPWIALDQPKHERNPEHHQHDVERQDVERVRLIDEQRRHHGGARRIEREEVHADVLGVAEVAEVAGRERQADAANHEQHQVPDVYLTDAVEDARNARLEPLSLEHARVGEHRGEAGEEDEDLRRIREAEVAQRELGEHVAGNVVDKDEEQGQAAKEVDSQIALCTGA